MARRYVRGELDPKVACFRPVGLFPAPFLAVVRGHQADIMATKPAPPRPVPRLYLATPEVDDPASLVANLPALLAGADVAAVVVPPQPPGVRASDSRSTALAPPTRVSCSALLLHGRD